MIVCFSCLCVRYELDKFYCVKENLEKEIIILLYGFSQRGKKMCDIKLFGKFDEENLWMFVCGQYTKMKGKKNLKSVLIEHWDYFLLLLMDFISAFANFIFGLSSEWEETYWNRIFYPI